MGDIQNLIAGSPYDAETLIAMEEHVNSQCVGRTKYNFDVNKALLKYYQAFPESVNIDLVGNVLILALMELPTTNYLALSYIVSPKFWTNNRLTVIKSIGNLLEKAQFIEFWEKYISNTEVFDRVRGFTSAIRQFIVGSLRDSCSTLSKDVFNRSLNIAADTEFNTFTKDISFLEVQGDLVVFQTQSVKAKQIDDKFKVDEILKLVDIIGAPRF